MATQEPPTKVCVTASGYLLRDNKILLIKHKKLGMWLSPGGHVEPDEMLHQSAEREFWEETGVKVRAIDPFGISPGESTDFVPAPIIGNLHWISKQNYLFRTQNQPRDAKTEQNWSKGCEQHVVYGFLMESPDKEIKYRQNVEETDGIAWFTLDEVKQAQDFNPDYVLELEKVFKIWRQLHEKNK